MNEPTFRLVIGLEEYPGGEVEYWLELASSLLLKPLVIDGPFYDYTHARYVAVTVALALSRVTFDNQ